ncbi:hypothetical protein RA307_18460 [Xanthobacteraceae bacterium Astr-EGSB]|uniref:hypothetical protein n=1 Tax=Astrobacterium formosum TaxID=3069710 RepID=UPI0027B28867|nr:hypothetical protein [Xanthobacteraceae bacterium Astr-EGSB]
MSSQVSSDSKASDMECRLPPHFTPRPKQDPVGMSALFVAVTVVCALGASSILISTRDGGSGIAGALDNLVAAVSRIGAPADTSDHTGSIAAPRSETRPAAADTGALASVLHASAQEASEEIARMGDDIADLRSAVAAVKKDVSSVQSLMAVSQTSAADAAEAAAELAVNAAVAPIKTDIKDLAARLSATRDDLTSGLAATMDGLAAVQSANQHMMASVDQMTSSHLRDIEAINRRIGKVEDVISLRADMTSAIPTRSIAPLPKRRALRRQGWTAEETSPGLYLIKGPTASYEVRDGDVIPGIGRVEVVRTADGKVRLLTGKDAARR